VPVAFSSSNRGWNKYHHHNHHTNPLVDILALPGDSFRIPEKFNYSFQQILQGIRLVVGTGNFILSGICSSWTAKLCVTEKGP
jgi:hypothetical protein